MQISPAVAQEKLQQYVARGRERSTAVIKELEREASVRQDMLVHRDVMSFLVRPQELSLVVHQPVDRQLALTRWSMDQVCSTLRIPERLITGLQADGDQGASVAERLMNDVKYRIADDEDRRNKDGRRLLRVVDNTVKGFLSPTYGLKDTALLLGAFYAAIKNHAEKGIVFTDGVISDRRCGITAIWPRVWEPIPGDFVVHGAELYTSDYGFGALDLKMFSLRLVCTNGAVGRTLVREIHRGKGYDSQRGSSFEISEQTRQLSAAHSISLMTDALRFAFSTANVENTNTAYREASMRTVDVEVEFKKLQKNGVIDDADKLIMSSLIKKSVEFLPDTENMNSALRFGQLLSWMSHESTGERVIEMVEAAGSYFMPK